jgi:hypothetical protein
MAVLKRRNRIVTFRLAEDEFEHIRSLCVAEGARSISDFARAALCNGATPRPISIEAGLDARMRRLDGKVEELDRAVKVLTLLLEDGRLK